MNKSWKLMGQRLSKPRPNMSISAVAIIFAAQTFVPDAGSYPTYMCILAWLSAGWITWRAISSRAMLGLLAIPVSLLWLNPILGGDWFNSVGVITMVSHSMLAMLWAVCAYTFLATERKN